MYRYFQPNPCGRSVGDCAVRAIAAAFDVSWEEAFDALAKNARAMCDLPNAESVWGSVLRMFGFECEMIRDYDYTVGDFADEHPHGVFVLGIDGHVVTVVDGVIMDSFDSSRLNPKFVWRRDRERRVKDVR